MQAMTMRLARGWEVAAARHLTRAVQKAKHRRTVRTRKPRMPPLAINLLGVVAILAIAFLLSSGKKRIRLRVVGPAFLLQVAIAALVLGTPWGAAGIQALA